MLQPTFQDLPTCGQQKSRGAAAAFVENSTTKQRLESLRGWNGDLIGWEQVYMIGAMEIMEVIHLKNATAPQHSEFDHLFWSTSCVKGSHHFHAEMVLRSVAEQDMVSQKQFPAAEHSPLVVSGNLSHDLWMRKNETKPTP